MECVLLFGNHARIAKTVSRLGLQHTLRREGGSETEKKPEKSRKRLKKNNLPPHVSFFRLNRAVSDVLLRFASTRRVLRGSRLHNTFVIV